MRKIFLLLLAMLSIGLQARNKQTRVLIIGIDGLCSEGVTTAQTPNIDQLMSEGKSTLTARNVLPTITMPNWTSHLTGSGPERHGVFTNDWTRSTAKLQAVAKDDDGYYPSIFKLLKDEVKGIKIGYYWNWEPLINAMNPRYMDETSFEKNDQYKDNYAKAFQFMAANRQSPTFVFLYDVHVDHAGHQHGWMSPQYITAIEEIDAEIGTLVDKMKAEGIYDNTYIILMTDHGGIDKGHGGYSTEETTIPWSIRGPGIKHGSISQQHFTINTAPIIAHIFNVKAPYFWSGHITESIF